MLPSVDLDQLDGALLSKFLFASFKLRFAGTWWGGDSTNLCAWVQSLPCTLRFDLILGQVKAPNSASIESLLGLGL